MFAALMLASKGLLIAAFSADTHKLRVPRVVPLRPEGQGAIFLLHPSSFVACCDDDDRLHYFLTANRSIETCLWAKRTPVEDRAVIYDAVCEWYDNACSAE